MLPRGLLAPTLVLVGLARAATAGAGSLSFEPTRVLVDPRRATTAVKVRNEGSTPVAVQVTALRWEQAAGGEDLYAPTDELVYFPRIFRLEPGARQDVRIGYRGPAQLAQERPFRLLVDELPIGPPGDEAVRMTLHVALPLFVQPRAGKLAAELGEVRLDGAALRLTVRNVGDVHVVVPHATMIGRDARGGEVFRQQTTGWYVLPAGAAPLSLALPATCRGAVELEIAVELASVDTTRRPAPLTARLPVVAGACSGP